MDILGYSALADNIRNKAGAAEQSAQIVPCIIKRTYNDLRADIYIPSDSSLMMGVPLIFQSLGVSRGDIVMPEEGALALYIRGTDRRGYVFGGFSLSQTDIARNVLPGDIERYTEKTCFRQDASGNQVLMSGSGGTQIYNKDGESKTYSTNNVKVSLSEEKYESSFTEGNTTYFLKYTKIYKNTVIPRGSDETLDMANEFLANIQNYQQALKDGTINLDFDINKYKLTKDLAMVTEEGYATDKVINSEIDIKNLKLSDLVMAKDGEYVVYRVRSFADGVSTGGFQISSGGSVTFLNDDVYIGQVNVLELVESLRYELPVASDEVLGGIKVGDNLQIDESGRLSVAITLGTAATKDTGTAEGTIPVLDSEGKIPNTMIYEKVTVDSVNGETGDIIINPEGIGAAEALHQHTKSEVTDFEHNHTKADITDFPTSMPANGGNADTVGGKSSTDFALSATSIIAGNGMSGGGTLASPRTLTLGTPSTITNSTTNSVSADSHAHALIVTKSDVGLGSVVNYGVATTAEAQAGTSDAKYMTPLKSKQQIDSNYSIKTGTISSGGTIPQTAGYTKYYYFVSINYKPHLSISAYGGSLECWVDQATRVVRGYTEGSNGYTANMTLNYIEFAFK